MVVEAVKGKSAMNVLITGSCGMLGSEICRILNKSGSYRISGLDLAAKPLFSTKLHSFVNCDITDYSRIAEAVKRAEPDILIHTAAYTNVDDCELDPDKAEAVNALGTRYVAESACKCDATLVYISTDFVFDGRKRSPYTESDVPNPLNVYGRSKLKGERCVMDMMKSKKFFIIRTSWLFGKGGRNFIDTILNKACIQKSIRVVSDQFGSPTYTVDLAKALAGLLSICRNRSDVYGIYHITNSDDCSWYKLAEKTLKLSNLYDVELMPILSEESDRPAQRPAMSTLDNSRYIRVSGRSLRRWDEALEEYIVSRRL